MNDMLIDLLYPFRDYLAYTTDSDKEREIMEDEMSKDEKLQETLELIRTKCKCKEKIRIERDCKKFAFWLVVGDKRRCVKLPICSKKDFMINY